MDGETNNKRQLVFKNYQDIMHRHQQCLGFRLIQGICIRPAQNPFRIVIGARNFRVAIRNTLDMLVHFSCGAGSPVAYQIVKPLKEKIQNFSK